jgi:hypothetical protein
MFVLLCHHHRHHRTIAITIVTPSPPFQGAAKPHEPGCYTQIPTASIKLISHLNPPFLLRIWGFQGPSGVSFQKKLRMVIKKKKKKAA